MKRLLVYAGALILVILVIAIPMVLVPLDRGKPYLLDPKYRLDEGWELGEVQPVYLFSFNRDGGKYLKAAIRDAGARIKLVDILVGGDLGDGKVSLAPFTRVGEKSSNKEEEVGFRYPLKPGQRFRVVYIASFDNVKEEVVEKACAASPRVCPLAYAMRADGRSALVFRETGSPNGIERLYALGVFEEVLDQYEESTN